MEIFTFLAGLAVGLLTWWISERRARRVPYRSKLANFLLPLQDYFRLTESIADELRGELADLEYPHLVTYFENLPNGDPRKVDWRQRIKQLHALNSDAMRLIYDKGGESSPQLREALTAFRMHATKWEALWEAVNSGEIRTNEVRASPFPRDVKSALESEIADTYRRAGIRRR